MEREFYAYLTSPNNAFVYVRGVSLLFDEYSINVQYNFSGVQDEHTQFVVTIIVDGLNEFLQDLCIARTK